MHWCIQTFHVILLVPCMFHTAALVYTLGNRCEKVNSQGHRARKWWSLGQEPRFSNSKPHAHPIHRLMWLKNKSRHWKNKIKVLKYL